MGSTAPATRHLCRQRVRARRLAAGGTNMKMADGRRGDGGVARMRSAGPGPQPDGERNHFGSGQVRVCLPELANNGPTHLTSADRWNWESDCSVIGIRPDNPGIPTGPKRHGSHLSDRLGSNPSTNVSPCAWTNLGPMHRLRRHLPARRTLNTAWQPAEMWG